jgi:hypothetical protein
MKKTMKLMITFILIILMISINTFSAAQSTSEFFTINSIQDEASLGASTGQTLSDEELAMKEVENLINGELEKIDNDTAYLYAVQKKEAKTKYLRDFKRNFRTNPELIEGFEKVQARLTRDVNKERLFNKIDTAIDQLIERLESQDVNTTFQFANPGKTTSYWDVANIALGPIMFPVKIVFLIAPGFIFQTISTLISNIGNKGVYSNYLILTLEHILFNKVAITDINLFDLTNVAGNEVPMIYRESNPILNIRTSISYWYYSLRNLAIIIQLCVLIYIGIRMVMATVADQKAQYKTMFKNWLIGFILIFVLHYFMVVVIHLNNILVDVFSTVELTYNGTYFDELFKKAWDFIPFIDGFAAAVSYLIITIVTFSFLIMYIRRVLITALLTVVAPLITVTYAIDKVGDDRSQILNKWMREYAFNILIQPFHCIVYLVFIKSAVEILSQNYQSLASCLIVIMCMIFIFIAEGIVRSIFNIGGSYTGKAVAATALAASAVTRASGKVSKKSSQVRKQSKDVKKMKEAMPDTKKKPALAGNTQDQKKSGNFGDKAKKVGKGIAAGVGKAYTSPVALGIGTAMLSGAISLAQNPDDEGKAVLMAQAGTRTGAQIGANISSYTKKKQIKKNEEKFTDRYNQFMDENPDFTNEQIEDYLEKEDMNDIPIEHQDFVAALRGMKETYKIVESEDSSKMDSQLESEAKNDVMNLIHKIRLSK